MFKGLIKIVKDNSVSLEQFVRINNFVLSIRCVCSVEKYKRLFKAYEYNEKYAILFETWLLPVIENKTPFRIKFMTGDNIYDLYSLMEKTLCAGDEKHFSIIYNASKRYGEEKGLTTLLRCTDKEFYDDDQSTLEKSFIKKRNIDALNIIHRMDPYTDHTASRLYYQCDVRMFYEPDTNGIYSKIFEFIFDNIADVALKRRQLNIFVRDTAKIVGAEVGTFDEEDCDIAFTRIYKKYNPEFNLIPSPEVGKLSLFYPCPGVLGRVLSKLYPIATTQEEFDRYVEMGIECLDYSSVLMETCSNIGLACDSNDEYSDEYDKYVLDLLKLQHCFTIPEPIDSKETTADDGSKNVSSKDSSKDDSSKNDSSKNDSSDDESSKKKSKKNAYRGKKAEKSKKKREKSKYCDDCGEYFEDCYCECENCGDNPRYCECDGYGAKKGKKSKKDCDPESNGENSTPVASIRPGEFKISEINVKKLVKPLMNYYHYLQKVSGMSPENSELFKHLILRHKDVVVETLVELCKQNKKHVNLAIKLMLPDTSFVTKYYLRKMTNADASVKSVKDKKGNKHKKGEKGEDSQKDDGKNKIDQDDKDDVKKFPCTLCLHDVDTVLKKCGHFYCVDCICAMLKRGDRNIKCEHCKVSKRKYESDDD
ncbi:hypothetical protein YASMINEVIRUS_1426 [Yasminevirus sp. GU-2018]|uniref:RING-type domain-containing protein n=1 Tax=Yasminevirus sp. GU-2018 TaxID=2420051 RepID=A0A5K0UBJ9_9VIRU|nr:hypothetical protein YASMINEVIRUS_1426 [Yasminevirus sp. GU-2018]